MTPELSVIIPVYNVENYLRRCVDSIRKQTLSNLEIILIDDGSTDESGRICDDLAKEDSRIRVIHKENEGQGIARNCGLDIAQGKYAAFVDSDDYMETDAYQYVIAQMEESDAGLACFGYIQEDHDGRIVYRSTVHEEKYENEEIKRKFILHFFGDDPEDDNLRGVSACMSIYRRDIINRYEIRFLSERKVFSEDTIFNLDYCKHIGTAIVCEKWFYCYCLKEDSFTKGYQDDRWELTLYFTKLLEKYAEEYMIEKEADKRIRMVLWVSLIDSVKQEVRLANSVSHKQIRTKIRKICGQPTVRELLEKLDVKGLNVKQKVFYYCIKCKWCEGLFWLSYLRNRRGL